MDTVPEIVPVGIDCGAVPSLQFGAVAILDALGFKGVWDGGKAESVLLGLRELTAALESFERGPDEFDPFTETRIRHFSDTLIIGVVVYSERLREKNPNLDEVGFASAQRSVAAMCVAMVCRICAKAIQLANRAQLPFAYRGAIAAGKFAIDSTHVIGPAIDNAAESEKLPDAAVVWLTPSATDLIDELPQKAADDAPYAEAARHFVTDASRVIDYPLPIKGGRELRTVLVNPYWGLAANPRRIVELRTELLRTFDRPTIDVLIKKQNTEAFLDFIERVSREP